VLHQDAIGTSLIVDPGVDPQSVLRAAQSAGPVEHFGFEAAGLSDIYRRLVAV
jgi:hypothetical protein